MLTRDHGAFLYLSTQDVDSSFLHYLTHSALLTALWACCSHATMTIRGGVTVHESDREVKSTSADAEQFQTELFITVIFLDHDSQG